MSDPTDLDPQEELNVFRARLDRVAADVIGLAPAPPDLKGDGGLLWHVASASLARLTAAYLDACEEQLDHLTHALEVGAPMAEVVSLDKYRQRRAAQARGGSPAAAKEGSPRR